jgi:hypothetical protein
MWQIATAVLVLLALGAFGYAVKLKMGQ